MFMFQVTNHEEVISQSLSSEDTKNKVVNFLSKVMNGTHPIHNHWDLEIMKDGTEHCRGIIIMKGEIFFFSSILFPQNNLTLFNYCSSGSPKQFNFI